jgi:SWI/SNF-related matrix-associated actin-dependent regulator 1 of chromatin subfamily A
MKQFAKGKVGWDFTGSAHLPEFHDRLRATCLLRRTKDQVLPELPPRIVTHVPLGMSPDGWTRYQAAAKDIKGWLAAKASVDPAWEPTIAHLGTDEREFARAERYAQAIEKLDGMELLLKLGTLRQVAAEGKLPLAIEWCRELCAARKLVVFAHHKAVVRGLADALRAEAGARIIDGETTGPRRQEAVRAFREDPACRLLSISITAGGTGLDGLQHAASDVAFLEYPWTPASLDQASSRVHRMGQAGTVHEWHLLARNTVDDDLAHLLDAKGKVCDALTDGVAPKEDAILRARDLARRLSR